MTTPIYFQPNNIWKSPTKRALVQNVLKNRHVTFENNTWKIDGIVLLTPDKHKLDCLKALFKIIFHRFKSLSKSYRTNFNHAIEYLNKVQKPNRRKSQLAAAISCAKEQEKKHTICKDNLNAAEQVVEDLQNKMSEFIQDYVKKKEEILHQHEIFSYRALQINRYILARKSEQKLSFIKKFYSESPQDENSLLNELLTYPEFKNINFKDLKDSELVNKKAEQEACAMRWLEKFRQLEVLFQQERKEKEEGLEDALKVKEEFERDYLASCKQMNRSPLKPKNRNTSRMVSLPETYTKVEAVKQVAAVSQQTLYISPPKIVIDTPAIAKEIAWNESALEFFDTLEKNINLQAAELWKRLFSNFIKQFGHANFISSFAQVSGNTFAITFREKLRIWISSTDNETGEENPKGGVIFLFGAEAVKGMQKERKKLIFAIDKGKIVFKEGFEMYLKTPHWAAWIPKIGEYILAKTTYMHFKNAKEVIVEGKAHLKSTKRTKTMQQLLDNWGTKAELIPNDGKLSWEECNQSFLNAKFI